MSAVEQKSYVLVADASADFQEELAKEVAGALPKLLSARTLRDCQRRLSSKSTNIVGVFINPSLGSPAWIAVVRDVHNYHPNTPIFVLYDYSMPDEDEMKKIGVKGIIKKPATYVELIEQLQLVPLNIPDATAAGGTVDPGYVPLKAARLMTKLPLQYDMHIKLADGHYTKVWGAGSSVSHEQLQRHVQEGVREYYILQKDQAATLKACKSHLERLLSDPTVTLEHKRAELAAVGEDTIHMLKALGIGEDRVSYALDFVEASQKLAVEMLRDLGGLQHFFTDVAVLEHSVAATLLGALMLSNIKMGPGLSFNLIGAALLLHDCDIWNEGPAIQQEDEAQMSDADKVVFHAHPARSAQTLKATDKFPPILIEAVEQHHMRLGGGFPKRQGSAGKVNRIGELIGICDEFAHHIEKTKGEPQAARVVLEKAGGGFSSSILSAFENTFLLP